MRALVTMTAVLTLLSTAVGCGTSGSSQATSKAPGPLVVRVSDKLAQSLNTLIGAQFLSPTRLAITGIVRSSDCRLVPARLVVRGRHAVRLELVVRRKARGACSKHERFTRPVVVSIDPARVDVHHALELALHYPKGFPIAIWPDALSQDRYWIGSKRLDVLRVLPLATARIREAVQVARASNSRLFSSFPSVPSERSCFPKSSDVTCQTMVRASDSGERVVVVSFVEDWPYDCLGFGCPLMTGPPPQPQHTWRIIERERGGKLQVVSVRSHGELPPQSS
jgi:hypothetical protein